MALTAAVPGTIASVLHREGDAVKEGDVVATLYDQDYQAAAAQARVRLEIARNEVARSQAAGDTAALGRAMSRLDEMRALATPWRRTTSPRRRFARPLPES